MNSEKTSPYKTTATTTTTTTSSSCHASSNGGVGSNTTNGNAQVTKQAQHQNQNSEMIGEAAINAPPPSKIDLHEFLDFLNVSCHVNELISSSQQQNLNGSNAGGGGGVNAGCVQIAQSKLNNANKPKTEVNFQKLAENRLVNELYGHKKNYAQALTSTDEAAASMDHQYHHQQQQQQLLSIDMQRRRSNGSGSGGATTSALNWLKSSESSTPTAPKTPPPPSTQSLHPKLSSKLDFVINEGILDSVLPFICPVQASNTTAAAAAAAAAARTKTKPKDAQNRKETAVLHDTEILQECEKEITVAPGNLKSSSGDTQTHTAGGGGGSCAIGSSGMVKFKDQRSFNRLKLHGQHGGNHHASADEKREPEVIIHVCDEVKNTSRDFSCPQNLLVSKMGYFADVTAGQKLDDMDISVHCDIHIFDWLMRWVKFSANGNDMAAVVSSSSNSGNSVNIGNVVVGGGVCNTFETGPQLDASNVVPILVSASFLQMEPLFSDCLSFCHARLSEVVRMSTNLSCLNDSIMTRLAAMFTNSELEMVRDKKERVTPRLWTKLIQSLCEPEPEALRGHFYSLAGLFRCARCEKCLTNTMKSYISCLPSNVRLNRWGQLVSHHVRDSNWDINSYITQLFKEQKSWRKVYWKLWGHCHFLYCCSCETHFPVYQLAWCRYHPEGPNFLGPVSEGRIAGPTGRYPCCGQKAFRFETMPAANGCQFREHSVLVETDRERAILGIVQLVFENHALCEPPSLKLLEAVANSADAEPRWNGLSLMPQRCRQGLLPIFNPDESTARIAKRARRGLQSNYFVETTSESDASDTCDEVLPSSSSQHSSSMRRRFMRKATTCAAAASFSTSSDGCESDFSDIKTIHAAKKGTRKRQTETPGRHWSGELSARSNQDHQREFEEKVMKQVAAIVSKKIGSEHTATLNSTPLGGTYVKLEAEWKEQLKQRTSNINQINPNSVGGGGGGGSSSGNQISCLTSATAGGAASLNVKPKSK